MHNELWRCSVVIGLCLAIGTSRQALAEEFREYTADSTGRYLGAAISSDNQLLAAAGAVSRRQRGLAVLWDIHNGKVIAKWSDFPGQCSHVAFSPNNEWLAVGCSDGSIHVFARLRDQWQRTRVIQHRPPTNYISYEDFRFTADSQMLISTCKVAHPVFVMAGRGLAVTPLQGSAAESRFVPLPAIGLTSMNLLDGQGDRVLLYYNTGECKPSRLAVIDTQSGDRIRTVEVPPSPKGGGDNLGLQSTLDGSRIVAIQDQDVYEILPEFLEFKPLYTQNEAMSNLHGMSLTQDGRRLARCSLKGSVQIWEIDSGSLLASREMSQPHGVHFANDGQLLATTAIGSNTIRVWNVEELIRVR